VAFGVDPAALDEGRAVEAVVLGAVDIRVVGPPGRLLVGLLVGLLLVTFDMLVGLLLVTFDIFPPLVDIGWTLDVTIDDVILGRFFVFGPALVRLQ